MIKKAATTPLFSCPKGKTGALANAPQKRRNAFWLWSSILIVVGLSILIVVSVNARGWIRNAQFLVDQRLPSPTTITLKVQRSASYAGLDMTVISAQYALSFADDDIRPGPAQVRLTMQLVNHTSAQITVVYYESAHLIVPKTNPVPPTNVHLSTGPKPGKSEVGWIDFSVPKDTSLDALALQLGSTTLGESLVKIPFKGAFDAKSYADRVSPQTAVITYNFLGHELIYHLISVNIRFAYQGSQCKAGQRFYILNFQVDNANDGDVSPGLGYDYVRLVVNGYGYPPLDNSLPYTFKAGAKDVKGHVVFSVPAGLNALTIGFLSQNGNGEQDTNVTLQ